MALVGGLHASAGTMLHHAASADGWGGPSIWSCHASPLGRGVLTEARELHLSMSGYLQQAMLLQLPRHSAILNKRRYSLHSLHEQTCNCICAEFDAIHISTYTLPTGVALQWTASGFVQAGKCDM